MLILKTLAAFKDHFGACLGPADWRRVFSAKINAFSDHTEDDHWIHVDAARAARDAPAGRMIVHGLYVLSLVPAWQCCLFGITRRAAGLCCGYGRI